MVHEAVCLDAASIYLWGKDDFIGDSIDARWRTGGTGSAAVVDAQDGGIVRLTTGATTNNDYYLDWANIRSLHVNKKVTIESRAKLSTITSITSIPISLKFDDNNRIWFRGAGGANWFIRTTDGGSDTNLDSGIVVDANYHRYKIECFPAGEVHFYIDDVECGNSPITTNIPDDAGDYLQPYCWVRTDENVAKSMDIDYVQWRQDI